MNQKTYETLNLGKSQCARIYIYLRKARKWVPTPEVARAASGKRNGGCGLSPRSRIHDLRSKYGVKIDHKEERIGRTVHGWYRLAKP